MVACLNRSLIDLLVEAGRPSMTLRDTVLARRPPLHRYVSVVPIRTLNIDLAAVMSAQELARKLQEVYVRVLPGARRRCCTIGLVIVQYLCVIRTGDSLASPCL